MPHYHLPHNHGQDIEKVLDKMPSEEAVDMSAPAISHHLKNLKKSGLIVSRREGKEVYYTLSHTAPAKLLHKTVDALFEISCPTD